MAVTDAQVAEVVERLSRDLRAWGLDSNVYLVEQEAAKAPTFVDDPSYYVGKGVEDVQQDILDQFIDTTWPHCPRHLQHSLWYHDRSWFCDQDGVANRGARGASTSRRCPIPLTMPA